MLNKFPTFSSFSTKDLKGLRKFYKDKLGIKELNGVHPEVAMFESKGTRFMVYHKPDHKPAVHTVLNFDVKNIEREVEDLRKKGIKFEQYKEMGADKKGIATMGSIKGAWFKDPSGNIVSLMEGN